MARGRRDGARQAHLLTGDPLSAAEAYELGIVTDLVDTPEEAEPVARKLAERIAALPPLAVQTTKRVSTTSSKTARPRCSRSR